MSRLLASGAQVICLDNFFTGARRNIERLLDHKYFELIRHDDTAKAEKLLGWRPTVALEDGLHRTIAYFEGLLRDPNLRNVIG